jgi:hypothetical protein
LKLFLPPSLPENIKLRKYIAKHFKAAKRMDLRERSGFIWLRIGTNVWLLRTWH